MNSSGDEDEDQFFESLDRIPSASESDTEEECGGDSARNGGGGTKGGFGLTRLDFSKYEIWKREPGSVQERRERLLRELGLRRDSHCPSNAKVNANTNCRRVQFAEIGPVAGCFAPGDVDGSVSCDELPTECAESSNVPDGPIPASLGKTDANSANGNAKFGHDKNNLANSPQRPGIGTNGQTNMGFDIGREIGDFGDGIGIVPPVDSNAELVVKIKNLDNGKEFVVNEVGKDGMWNKLKEVDTGRQLSLEEFDRVVGHSPLVQELMRRENVEREGQESPDLRIPGGKGKKKGGWLRTIKGVVLSSNKEKKSSDEKDTSSEKGGRRSSSATDDSQEILYHMPKKTKVKQYGKTSKEFSALHMGQEIQAHQGSIWALRFSLDGRYLASGGQDRIIHVWQVIESKQRHDTPAEKSEDVISNTYVSAYGSTELSLSIDSAADKKKKGLFLSGRRSSTTTTDCIFLPESILLLSEKPTCSFEGHLDDVLDLSWSQSQYLLSSSMDKTVRLWHMSRKCCLRVFSHNDFVTCIQFNPIDDRYFISGSLDKKVRIWSIPDRKVVDWTDIYEMVTAACYTPDGQGALVGTHKGNCNFYSTSGNRLQEEAKIEVQKKKKKKKSRGKKITGFQFAPKNPRKVLITSADSRIRIFDGAELVQTFKGFRNTNSQISASFTANGKYVVSASEDSYVYIWNDDFPSNPAARNQRTCQAYEYFLSQKVSAAIPWHGTKSELFPLSSSELMPGRKSASFPHASTSQGYEVTLYNSPLVPMSGKSEIRMVERNDNILEGARLSNRSEGFVRETTKTDVFLACNDRENLSGTVRVDASSISDSMRAMDHSSPSHGLFAESLSKGSATWPEEKLPAFTVRSPNLAASEPRNSNYESVDGSSVQDPSITAAWGSVIVTASLGGEIRTFQNYGWPVPL